MAIPASQAALVFNQAIPFLAQGASATVSGVQVTASVNTAVQGDSASTYLHQSNSRITTTLTFNPPISNFKAMTRAHADALPGFEEYQFLGKDSSNNVVFYGTNTSTPVKIRNLDGSFEYLSGSGSGNITAPMTTLEILYVHDTPITDEGRGSYLNLYLPQISLTPETQSYEGGVGTQLSTTAYTAIGFTGSVTYAVTSGTLPQGLSINASTGVVSGKPSQAESGTVTVTATGATSGTKTATIFFDIIETLTPSSQTIYAVAGTQVSTPAYIPPNSLGANPTYAATSGTLPAGIRLDTSTGVFSGIPTRAGTYTARIVATAPDSSRALADVTFVISVALSPAVQSIDGFAGSSLKSQDYVAYGFGSGVGYSVISGTLPAGLSINATTGVVSGTPTTVESRTVTVQALQGSDSATATITFNIVAPTVVTSPPEKVTEVVTVIVKELVDGGVSVDVEDPQGAPTTVKVVAKKPVAIELREGRLGVTDPKFSGRVQVDIIVTDARSGVTTTTTELVVHPVAPAAAAVRSQTKQNLLKLNSVYPATTPVSWQASPNATGYQVLVDGVVVTTTTRTSAVLPMIVGPKQKVQVLALGNDDTMSRPVLAVRSASSLKVAHVNFASSSFALTNAAKRTLDNLAAVAVQKGFTQIRLEGHTDNRGSKASGVKLSRQRSATVAAYLRVQLKGTPIQVVTASYASTKLVVTSSGEVAQAPNRRVEVSFTR